MGVGVPQWREDQIREIARTNRGFICHALVDTLFLLDQTRDERDGLFRLLNSAGEMPSDEVFRFFQRLHGLPETGAPSSAPPETTPA